jgi:hypothetical protein
MKTLSFFRQLFVAVLSVSAALVLIIALVGAFSVNVYAAPSPIQMIQIKAGKNKVSFKSGNAVLKGHLHVPASYQKGRKLSAVIVTGSWTTVKEMMPDLYARKLAEQGFVALTFDFRGWGESEGQPRNLESPELKTQDIINAVTYLQTLKIVDADKIAGLGICASAGYLVTASAQDKRIRSISLVAPWLHDADLVKAIYGGQEGVNRRIAEAEKANAGYNQTGQMAYVPAISLTDSTAAMFGNWDYYLNPERGAVPQWDNRFAVGTWKGWLEFNPIAAAPQVTAATLVVHSEQAAIPDGAKKFYFNLTAPKEFEWLENRTQFDFYDQEATVNEAAAKAAIWFKKNL